MATSQVYQNDLSRADYLRDAQVKLAQAALYLHCADDDPRAQVALRLSREVQQLRRAAASTRG